MSWRLHWWSSCPPPLFWHTHTHISSVNQWYQREHVRAESDGDMALYCIPSSATTPAVNPPVQLKHCSHDLWPRNCTAGERLSASGFWSLKLKVQTAQGTAPRVRSWHQSTKKPHKKTSWTLALDQTWSNMVASHQRFGSHGLASEANSAPLFARLISGVVTSGGTHRLTSVQQNYLKKKNLKTFDPIIS